MGTDPSRRRLAEAEAGAPPGLFEPQYQPLTPNLIAPSQSEGV